MARRPPTWAAIVAAVVAAAGSAPAPAVAQTRSEPGARDTATPRGTRGAPSRSGLEVQLSGDTVALVGRPLHVRGRAFEVRGLATLAPLPGARVRARFETDAIDVPRADEVTAAADAEGDFTLEVPVPAVAHGEGRLVVTVAHGDDEREVHVPIRLAPPIGVEAFTDRALYEPGETVRVWTRVVDALTGAPVEGAAVTFHGFGRGRRVVTRASGVASVELPLDEGASAGSYAVTVEAGSGVARAGAELGFAVGRRAVDTLLVDLDVAPEVPAPEQELRVVVRVRAPSGAPVRGAAVRVEVASGPALTGVTDEVGTCALTGRAPAYLSGDSGVFVVRAAASHPGHGRREVSATHRLTHRGALELRAVAPAGGLVPEVDGRVWITVAHPDGSPPAGPVRLRVRGAAVRGGRAASPAGGASSPGTGAESTAGGAPTAELTTDRHGIAELPVRVPVGGFSRHVAGDCADTFATSVEVTIDDETRRTARLCVPVAPDAGVAVAAARPALAPGEALELSLRRRPAFARAPVVIDVVARTAARGHSAAQQVRVAGAVVRGDRDRAILPLPDGLFGVLRVVARPLRDGSDPASFDAAGGVETVLVRPARPIFPVLSLDRATYEVRGTARLRIEAPPGAAGPAHAAVLVRDLAMHGGERPFAQRYLGGRLAAAVLDPSTPEADRLVRTALAEPEEPDLAPAACPPLVDALGARIDAEYEGPRRARGDLRDPFALARELRLRGVGGALRALEASLEEATEAGDFDGVAVGRGAARRFVDDLPARAAPDAAQTLGEGELTMSMLDPRTTGFSFEASARRVARRRLVILLGALARYLDPGPEAPDAPRAPPGEPADRWLARLVQLGLVTEGALNDPWGGRFVLVRRPMAPGALVPGIAAAGLALVSPGPDGVAGNADDVSDPFARVVPAGTPYAVASGEDELMRALAALSLSERALAAIAAAYARLDEAAEAERRGDAVYASASEGPDSDSFGLGGFGTIGHGAGGGGYGSGYGRGAGGLTGRSSRAPSIRAGAALVTQGGGRGAPSALARRRFPATLHFATDLPLDPSGRTEVPVPLADAATTYLVEVVVWDPQGWVWSEQTEIRVDKEILVDAPVPAFAAADDVLDLPVRVANRAPAPFEGWLRVSATEALGVGVIERRVAVPAGDAARVALRLPPLRRGQGIVRVALVRAAGGAGGGGAPAADALEADAVEREIVVRDEARPDVLERAATGSGEVVVALDPPEGAVPAELATVEVRTLDSVLAPSATPGPWRAWHALATGAATDGAEVSLDDGASVEGEGRDEPELRELVRLAARLRDHDASGDAAPRAVTALVARCAGEGGEGEGEAARARVSGAEGSEGEGRRRAASSRQACATALALLSPAAERGADLIVRLRQALPSHVAAAGDAPAFAATAAAAMALAGRTAADRELARALAARAEARLVRVGSGTWLHPVAPGDAAGLGAAEATAWLALAHTALGERAKARALLLTLADAARRDEARASQRAGGLELTPRARAVAAVAAARLSGARRPAHVRLEIAGTRARTLAFTEAGARAALPMPRELRGRSLRATLFGPTPSADAEPLGSVEVLVTLRVPVDVPWRPTQGPGAGLSVAWSGEPPQAVHVDATGAPGTGEREGLTLHVASQAAHRLRSPELRVSLPAGFALDAEGAAAVARVTGLTPLIEGRTLVVPIRPLRPGERLAIPMPLRATTGGTLRGLGLVATDRARPDRRTVLPPRALEVALDAGPRPAAVDAPAASAARAAAGTGGAR